MRAAAISENDAMLLWLMNGLIIEVSVDGTQSYQENNQKGRFCVSDMARISQKISRLQQDREHVLSRCGLSSGNRQCAITFLRAIFEPQICWPTVNGGPISLT